jgi:hypothetical protein
MSAKDWKRAHESSIWLLQSSRCGHRLAVGNVAMKSMDWARASGHQPSLRAGSFPASISARKS